jgi:hypothetical protein
MLEMRHKKSVVTVAQNRYKKVSKEEQNLLDDVCAIGLLDVGKFMQRKL